MTTKIATLSFYIYLRRGSCNSSFRGIEKILRTRRRKPIESTGNRFACKRTVSL